MGPAFWGSGVSGVLSQGRHGGGPQRRTALAILPSHPPGPLSLYFLLLSLYCHFQGILGGKDIESVCVNKNPELSRKKLS